MRPSIQLIGPRPAKIGELAVKAEAAGFEAAGLPSPYGFYTGMGVLAEATNEILLASSILPLFNACFKFFCQIFQCGALFSKENTPMFKWGINATCLAIFSENPEDFACL